MTYTCAFCGTRRPSYAMARIESKRYPSEWLCNVGRSSCFKKATANAKSYDSRKANGGEGSTRFVTPKKRKTVTNPESEQIDQVRPDQQGET